jgi:hypothetical protein
MLRAASGSGAAWRRTASLFTAKDGIVSKPSGFSLTAAGRSSSTIRERRPDRF